MLCHGAGQSRLGPEATRARRGRWRTRPIRLAIEAAAAPTARPGRGYPEPFATRVAGRVRRPLGDLFGLTNFGVNLTRLPPGGMSALRHTHAREDEFIYILEGEPVLVTNAGETQLRPGMCAGFKAGSGDGHHLLNRTIARCGLSGDRRSQPWRHGDLPR